MKFNQLILILLVFGFIFCACEGNKNENFTVYDLKVISKYSSEGIHLHIDNIPEEAMYLFVSLYNITTNDGLYTGASFQGNELKQLKKTGILICPFVKNGHEYIINVTAGILTEENIKTINSNVITATAYGGIYMVNNPTLIWNNSNNIATLSARPVFSDEKINSQNAGLNYGLVYISEETSGGVCAGLIDLTYELTFDNTQNYNSIIEIIGNMDLNGDISIYADVQLSLEYDAKMWTLVFAKTEEIVYSL
jgi:hypothetical protein